jgi:hypothetical protein
MQPRDRPLQFLFRPFLESQHAHARDAQSRKHLTDVAGERGSLGHHHHALGGESFRVSEIQVGEAMQSNGGLATACAALDHHHAGMGRGHNLELARIDKRCDLG